MTSRHLPAATLSAAAILTLAACHGTQPPPGPSRTAGPNLGVSGLQQWAEGEARGPWTVRYTGFGTVRGTESSVLLEPQSASSQDRTHGGLVHTTQRCTDASFALTLHTAEHVREGAANPWEVAWVLWNFHDDERFYSLALKPNGWEVAKQDPAYPGSQRFLASGARPRFPIGQDYRVEITQDWPRMTISVDGRTLTRIVDEDDAYRGGAVALYTEDARVLFTDFDLPACLMRAGSPTPGETP